MGAAESTLMQYLFIKMRFPDQQDSPPPPLALHGPEAKSGTDGRKDSLCL